MDHKESNNIIELLEKLPPGYTVGAIYVKGIITPVANFINIKNGLAYFLGVECQVCVFDADSISGICFSEPIEIEEEEEV